MINSSVLLCFLLVACHFSDPSESITASPTPVITSKNYPPNSWQYYLQHLPVHKGLVKDFTGKTIKPFCTHEGSGMGHSEEDIRKLCPNTDVRHGLAITGARVRQAMPEIKKWLEK